MTGGRVQFGVGLESAQPGRALPHARVGRWLIPAALLAALAPLASTPVLPMIDFYNHIMRYDLLRRLGSDPVLDANYLPNWAVLPNVGLDVLAMGLLAVVPVDWLPHLLAVLVVVALFAGVMMLSRAVNGRTHWLTALLVVPLLYSWIFNWGFVNFLFGLGFALAAAGWWISRRDQALLRLAVAVPVAVLIFFAHGVAFALYGITIAMLELGYWWQSAAAGRRFQWPALRQLAAALGQCQVQAIIPVLLFARSSTVGAAGGLTNADESLARLVREGALADRLQALAAHRLESIVRVAEGPGYAADALWLALALGLLAVLWRARLIRLPAVMWPLLAVAGLLVLACPPALFGIGYVADRMPLFMALLVVASLRPAPGLTLRHPAVIGLAVLVAVRLVSLMVQWQGLATDLSDLDRVASRLPPASMVVGLAPGATPHEDMPQRCEMFPHILGRRHHQIVPVFAIGTSHTIKMQGRLARAKALSEQGLAPLRFRPGIARQPAPMVSVLAAAGYDYVLLCQVSRDAPRPPLPFPVLAESGRFRLIDVHGGPKPAAAATPGGASPAAAAS